MGRTIRNSIIHISSILGFSSWYRARNAKRGPLVRVVVFHDVLDPIWFKKSLVFLKEKYHVITPEEFATKSFKMDAINVLITFDDGYASWVTVAGPVLAERNCRALFFVNSGLLDSARDETQAQKFTNDKLLLKTKRTLLTWEGLQTLAPGGHAIGGHSRMHERLSGLGKAEQYTEVVEDKNQIESKLGKTISLFAYPFGSSGDYTSKTITVVREAGYICAFTTEAAFFTGADPYTIPRVCIEDGMSESLLKGWIEGGYDLYAKMKQLCVQ